MAWADRHTYSLGAHCPADCIPHGKGQCRRRCGGWLRQARRMGALEAAAAAASASASAAAPRMPAPASAACCMPAAVQHDVHSHARMLMFMLRWRAACRRRTRRSRWSRAPPACRSRASTPSPLGSNWSSKMLWRIKLILLSFCRVALLVVVRRCVVPPRDVDVGHLHDAPVHSERACRARSARPASVLRACRAQSRRHFPVFTPFLRLF